MPQVGYQTGGRTSFDLASLQMQQRQLKEAKKQQQQAQLMQAIQLVGQAMQQKETQKMGKEEDG